MSSANVCFRAWPAGSSSGGGGGDGSSSGGGGGDGGSSFSLSTGVLGTGKFTRLTAEPTCYAPGTSVRMMGDSHTFM
jgi:hypothetical protein